jgi:hypothetical protein
MGIFQSSGKQQNPAVGLSILAGAVGAAFSLVLWLYAYRPDTGFLGEAGREIAAKGVLHDNLQLLAALFGVIAILASIIASLGGRGRWTTATGLGLGLVALSYPVLSWLNLVTGHINSPI